MFVNPCIILIHDAPVAQLDRVPGYEPGGRGFESYPARQTIPKALKAFGISFMGFAFLLLLFWLSTLPLETLVFYSEKYQYSFKKR